VERRGRCWWGGSSMIGGGKLIGHNKRVRRGGGRFGKKNNSVADLTRAKPTNQTVPEHRLRKMTSFRIKRHIKKKRKSWGAISKTVPAHGLWSQPGNLANPKQKKKNHTSSRKDNCGVLLPAKTSPAIGQKKNTPRLISKNYNGQNTQQRKVFQTRTAQVKPIK